MSSPEYGTPKSHSNLSSYLLLRKLPAILSGFYHKRRFFPFGVTSVRFFMLKSQYLICFDKIVSERLFSSKGCSEKDYVDLANREEIKRVISLQYTSIEKKRNSNSSFPMEVILIPKRGKPLCIMMKNEAEGELWYSILMTSRMSIQLNEFDIIGELGRGAFGKVELVRYRRDDQLYGMKTIILSGSGSSLLKQLVEERTIMQKLHNCPFIVQLQMAFYEDLNLHYVLEYCEKGDLQSYIRAKGCLGEEEIRVIGGCIILAIGCMHAHHLLHRDIKPENILLKENGIAKLADFGLSKTLTSMTSRAFSFCGTDLYRPPEMSKQATGYNRSLDWWQVGCILYEMATGKPPFEGTKEERRVKVLKEEPSYPTSLSPELKALLQGLLVKDSLNRLGGGMRDVEEVKQCAFFDSLNWSDLEKKASLPSTIQVGIPSPIRPEEGGGGKDTTFDRTNLLGFEYDKGLFSTIMVQVQKVRELVC